MTEREQEFLDCLITNVLNKTLSGQSQHEAIIDAAKETLVRQKELCEMIGDESEEAKALRDSLAMETYLRAIYREGSKRMAGMA